jgi:hypothetical protein
MEIFAVSASAFMLLKNQNEALTIGLIAGLTFLVLDYFVPAVGAIARKGVGIGFGLAMVGGSPKNDVSDKSDMSQSISYKMIPTCPDPNNSGKALLAGYNENVTPAGRKSLSSWPFAESQVIAYGSCDSNK